MKKKTVCFLMTIFMQLSIFIAGAIPAEERAALIALYNSTGGDLWYNATNWKTPPLHTDGFSMPGTEGTWYGITLSGDHVLWLILSDNNLEGYIPPELGNLSQLQFIYLQNNRLGCYIPPSLGNLSHLLYLNLNSNELIGSIPPELGKLSQLQILYLNYNQLSGTIPPELGNLSQLLDIELGDNQLSGTLPAQLSNLSNLEELWIFGNHLSGTIPPELSNLSNLLTLGLYSNQLSGEIPRELGNMSKVKHILLFKNQLSGNIPPELGNLSNLEDLSLNNNQLSGAIPSQLGSLGQLVGLDLGYNQLSCKIPPELGKLSNLRALDLGYNQLVCDIPPELGNLSKLKWLRLSNNRLSGDIPSSFTNLPVYNLLDVGYNCLSASAGDQELINWLNNWDPDWEETQDQCACEITTPTVTTKAIFLTLNNQVQCGGNVTSDGGTAVTGRGVCWNTSGSPTIGDNKTSNGTGTGSFTTIIPGLIPGITYYIRAYATNCLGTSYGSVISYTIPGGIHTKPEIYLNRTSLYFGSLRPRAHTGSQTVLIDNSGGGTLNWNAAVDVPWLSVTPTAGTNAALLSAAVEPSGLAPGNYTGTIAVTDPNADNSPQTVTVYLHVIDSNDDASPIGAFTTPIDGAAVMGSIPVTGWALDDIEIAQVKLYVDLNYMGDAVFIEGARPDIEAAYPGYPQNDRAGWGYMMLTNFLPDGDVVLTAIAIDTSSKETILGKKSITIANAKGENPFGTIDTPVQGGTASGSNYSNVGWVLTPMPNLIPSDGSTISVWVDGLFIGHPDYGKTRVDVAALFPGYANSDNAGANYTLDTTVYQNGLHTIFWTAADNAGNQDGIGSRFFNILNTGKKAAASGQQDTRSLIPREEPDRIPLDYSGPVIFKKGFAIESSPQKVYPDDNGITSLSIRELERVIIYLAGPAEAENPANGNYTGYLAAGDRLVGLPVGSTLDRQGGIFYWIPGPGFIGTYNLIFFTSAGDWQKKINITILPKN